LPPKLPQQDDFKTSHEHELLKSVLSVIERFKSYINDSSTLQAAIDMVRTMINYRPGSSLNVDAVGATLRNIYNSCKFETTFKLLCAVTRHLVLLDTHLQH
jgi:hypothetical protein